MNPAIEKDEGTALFASRFSWSAVFAGAILATGLWILLHAIGLAVEMSSVNPNNPDSLRSAGIGMGVWSLIAAMIALFVGGLAAARIAGPIERATGALHGALLWAMATTAAVAYLVSAAGLLVRTVALAAGNAPRAASELTAQNDTLMAVAAAGRGLWWAFFALLLGLISAVLGASAVSHTQHRPLERTRELPIGPTAQVHP